MPRPESLSPRLQALMDELVQLVPIKKQADRAALASKHLGEVLIQYLTWKARLIRPRPRSVVIWPEVASSPHYATYASAIGKIKSPLERGDDMNAYVSNQAHVNAYAGNLPAKTASMSNEEWVKKAWRGKDRVRVTLDAHHLHLGEAQLNGKVDRSGPLLFAGISQNEAFLLTIGDHDSFDDGTVSRLMREKLDAALAEAGGGAALAGPGITLAGTQIKDTFGSIKLVKTLREIDAKLDDEGFPGTSVRSFKLDWDDILVVDSTNGTEVTRIPGQL